MEPQNQGFDETKTLGAPEDNMKDSKDYTNRDFSNTMHLCREDDVPLFNRAASLFFLQVSMAGNKTPRIAGEIFAGKFSIFEFT